MVGIAWTAAPAQDKPPEAVAKKEEEKPAPPPPVDTLILQNGDTLTGTVVGAGDGTLTFRTDYSGETPIDVSKIKALETQTIVTVRLDSGETLRGRIVWKEGDTFTVLSEVEGDTSTAHWDRLSAINPPEK